MAKVHEKDLGQKGALGLLPWLQGIVAEEQSGRGRPIPRTRRLRVRKATDGPM